MVDKNKQLEAIAEQWVNLVLAHIEVNKQKANKQAVKNKEQKKEQE